jgi:hypothetical protein
MIDEEQKRRIRLYSPRQRSQMKAERRRADAADVARGDAEGVQERNRALPPAAQFEFTDLEELTPTE